MYSMTLVMVIVPVCYIIVGVYLIQEDQARINRMVAKYERAHPEVVKGKIEPPP